MQPEDESPAHEDLCTYYQFAFGTAFRALNLLREWKWNGKDFWVFERRKERERKSRLCLSWGFLALSYLEKGLLGAFTKAWRRKTKSVETLCFHVLYV